MVNDWLIEWAKGFGKFFLNPLFYFSIILAVFGGVRRMKRERRDFHTSVYPIFHELRFLFPAGILAGVCLSVVSIAAGFTASFAMIVMIAVTTVLLGLAGNLRLLSPAFTAGTAFLLLFAAKQFHVNIPLLGSAGAQTTTNSLLGLAVLMGLLLAAEGILMIRNGEESSSPRLRKSRRGLTVGAFQAKRLWLVPLFCLLPAGPLTSPFDWWPVITWNSHSFSIVCIPFLIGFQQQIQSSLPQNAIKKLGKQIVWTGIVTVILAAGGFWISYFSLAAAASAILGRAWISYQHRVRENANPYMFVPQKEGVMVLAVIPGTPADKLSLKTGELIYKCNGIRVQNKNEIYQALQKNGAYCKLEVIDNNKEIRFVQGALYEGDHHELGILTMESWKVQDGHEAS